MKIYSKVNTCIIDILLYNYINSTDYDVVHNYTRPGLHMMCEPSKLIIYTPDEHKKDHICHIASLEVVRGVKKSFEIDYSGFSLANGTLTVSNLVHSMVYVLMWHFIFTG